ncbi:hypothetical protein AB0F91_21030 [Amycolatopsis sp. NPDC023774]|uniref:hypothetical protein n=1 Tax=Amycolatopsis sp. NPDC023774 TaxID=3155015 RepID=UPI0033F42A82
MEFFRICACAPPRVRHQQPADVAGASLAQDFGQEMQRQIGGREAPARGGHRTVVEVETAGFEAYVGGLAAELRGEQPVRGGAASVQRPGPGQQERTAAARHHPRAVPGRRPAGCARPAGESSTPGTITVSAGSVSSGASSPKPTSGESTCRGCPAQTTTS